MKKKKSKLQNVNLGNIAEINPPNNISEDFINYIDISSAKEGKVSSCKRFRTEDRPSRAQRKIKSGDIVISSVRPENKSYFFVNKNYNGFIASTGFVVIRPKIAYPRYLYYYLIRNEMINLYSINTGGSAYPALNPAFFNNLKIQLPPLSIQKKIASILSAYDDLIEVNERKIKILEDMAKLIYKEWFVKFKFPGHEKVGMVESELGPIPEGWGICEIGSIGKVITGKTPSTKEVDNFGDYMPFITIPDMHNNIFVIKTERYLSKKGVIKQSNKTLPQNAICVSCIATMGLVVIATENSQTNQQINSVVLDDLSTLEYLFFVFKSLRTKITLYGGSGTAANILNKEKFSKLKIVNPEKKIIEQFHCLIEPVFKQIENIMRQNNILRQTRDMLLPKLTSGKIDV